MNKLLIICGPTGTGKTALGVYLAKKFDGEIISADSRQVYKGFDIGTGKTMVGDEGVKIWGYDLALPSEEFSVSSFVNFSDEKIKDMASRKKLPIIVGGTGLYIRSLVNGFEEVHIPPDKKLREKLGKVDASKLYEILKKKDITYAFKMNESDKKNPVRLIRAIEKLESTDKIQPKAETRQMFDELWIGLHASQEYLYSRVTDYVEARIKAGFEKEVIKLVSENKNLNSQAFSSTGYKQYLLYLKGVISLSEAKEAWVLAERQYIKRQLTWFRKEKNINWFDIQNEGFRNEVEELVERWHNNV